MASAAIRNSAFTHVVDITDSSPRMASGVWTPSCHHIAKGARHAATSAPSAFRTALFPHRIAGTAPTARAGRVLRAGADHAGRGRIGPGVGGLRDVGPEGPRLVARSLHGQRLDREPRRRQLLQPE